VLRSGLQADGAARSGTGPAAESDGDGLIACGRETLDRRPPNWTTDASTAVKEPPFGWPRAAHGSKPAAYKGARHSLLPIQQKTDCYDLPRASKIRPTRM
jgi:hypothetical protein